MISLCGFFERSQNISASYCKKTNTNSFFLQNWEEAKLGLVEEMALYNNLQNTFLIHSSYAK
jgi:hypothetical protein